MVKPAEEEENETLYKGVLKGTIAEIKEGIEGMEDPDYDELIQLEKKGKSRKSLVGWLESRSEKEGAEEEKKTPIEEIEEKKKEKPIEKTEDEVEKKVEERKEKPIEKIKYHGRRYLSVEEKRLLRGKKNKPKFIRQEYHKLKKLKDVWRRPKGLDSKKHNRKRGKGKVPQIGYKKPESVRGIHPLGYSPIVIHNTKDLKEVNPDAQAVVIASAVGRKKRNDIIAYANKNKLFILNPRAGEI
ncbi:MAG: 50S ribosomal protein L32e [Candidatus Altiarchaeales archaeon]|nr:50S ribosomal protein L32e [Candidatus Altiarchaeales archaeon]